MGRYALRRLLAAIPVLLGVTMLNYALINMAPGSPVDALVSPIASPEEREEKRLELGLDQPIYTQFFIWSGKLLQGDFGESFFFKKTVASLIGGDAPSPSGPPGGGPGSRPGGASDLRLHRRALRAFGQDRSRQRDRYGLPDQSGGGGG